MGILGKIIPFSFEADNLLALDIGSYDIKIAEFKKSQGIKGWLLDKCEIKQLPKISDEKDKSKEIVKILKGIFAGKDNKRTRIVCLINDSNSVEKRLITPLMDKNELKEAIFWKMKDFIHFPLEEACIDFKIIGQTEIEGETKDEILAVAFPKNTINYYLWLFKEAKIMPASFISLATCFEQALRAMEGKRDETIAFVDLGARHCQLAIFKNRKFIFSRQLPVTGDAITKALSAVLDDAGGRIALTFEDAERLKVECGIPSPGNEQIPGMAMTCNQVLSLIRPEIEKLTSEIEHSFDYYREEFGAVKIDRLYLIGAGANLKGLDSLLSKQLNVEVKKCSLFPEEENTKKKIDNPCAVFSCLAAAKSLIAEIVTGSEDINLLPRQIKEQKKLLLRRLSLEVATTVLVLVGLLSIIWVKLAIMGINKRLEATKTQAYSLKYSQRQASLKEVIGQIYAREPRWGDVFKEISNLIPANMHLEHLAYDKDELILEGLVVLSPEAGEGTLSNFMLALEKGIFKNVTLIESKNIKDDASLARTEFKLKCQAE